MGMTAEKLITVRPHTATPTERMKLAWIEAKADERREFLKWLNGRGDVAVGQRIWGKWSQYG